MGTIAAERKDNVALPVDINSRWRCNCNCRKIFFLVVFHAQAQRVILESNSSWFFTELKHGWCGNLMAEIVEQISVVSFSKSANVATIDSAGTLAESILAQTPITRGSKHAIFQILSRSSVESLRKQVNSMRTFLGAVSEMTTKMRLLTVESSPIVAGP
jgi:hypothetical protein